MTPALRKYHRQVWFFMAGFLPVLFVAAVVVIPEKRASEAPLRHQPDALPVVLRSTASSLFVAKLRGDESTGERQLEIELARPLPTPSALVYLMEEAGANPLEGTLLGSLSSQNIYRFNLGKAPLSAEPHILLFDPIKNATIGYKKL